MAAVYAAGGILCDHSAASVATWNITGVAISVDDTLVVGVSYGGLGTATNRTITLADSLGNIYTEVALPAAQWDSGNSSGLRTFVCKATVAGTATITATPSLNCDFVGIGYHKFTGGTATSDGATCAVVTSTSAASGAITTTANGDIVVGFFSDTSTFTGTLTTSGGSFSNKLNDAGGGLSVQSQIQASAGSIDSTATMSIAHKWICAVVAITEAATGPTTNLMGQACL